MVDKKLSFLSKNSNYGVVLKSNPFQNIEHNVVYSDGSNLKYGDEAEIFGAIREKDLMHFMQCAITENYYTKDDSHFIFGYQPADYENEEIKENDVKIQYAGVNNTITKKEFYDLCLLLCDAKLNGLDLIEDKEVSREQLLSIKSQIEEKIKAV
jgi:hypothetical protein